MKAIDVLFRPLCSKEAKMKFFKYFCMAMFLVISLTGFIIITDSRWQLEPKEVLGGIVLILVLINQIALVGMLMEVGHKLDKLEGKQTKN